MSRSAHPRGHSSALTVARRALCALPALAAAACAPPHPGTYTAATILGLLGVAAPGE